MALKLKGSTSGFVAIDAPSVAGNNTLILPENSGSAFQLFANDITAGVTTFTSVSVNRNGDLTVPGTISIGGTLTYEDVTSVDSVGVVTARGLSIFGNTTGLQVASGISTFQAVTGTTGTFSGIVQSVQFKLLDNAKAIYGTGADMEIYHNATNSLIQNGTGALQIITSSDLYQQAANAVTFNTNGSNERARIDSNGRLIIGHTASTGEARYFQVIGTTGDTSSIQLIRHSANASCSQIDLSKSRNATKGSNTIVQDDDVLGQITFRGDDGTDLNSTGATISAAVDGTPGSNDMPGRLVFSTTADGANSATERLRIQSDGTVRFYNSIYGGDNKPIYLGNSNDFSLFHDSGGASIIRYNHSVGGLHFRNNSNADQMIIDSNGRLIIGHTSATSISGHTPQFQLQGAHYNTQTLSVVSNSADANPAYLFLSKQRSGAAGGNTIVQANDRVGEIRFNGNDGVDFNCESSLIASEIDGTPGADDMPGRLVFYTTPDGSQAPTERLRITSDGKMALNHTTPPSDFVVRSPGGSGHCSSQVHSGDSSTILNIQTVQGSEGRFGMNTNHPLAFYTNGNERLRLHDDGRISANTTTKYGIIHSLEDQFNPGNEKWLTDASYVASGSFGGGYVLLDGSKGYSMYCAGNGANFFIQHHSSTTAAGSGGVTITNGATSWTSASDERDKENLVTISDAITKIKTLRTVTGNYTWQTDVKHAFLIAQDVQAVLPEAVDIVNTNEETEKQRLGLRYTEVIPLLTAALQEAVAKIETLETKVAALEG